MTTPDDGGDPLRTLHRETQEELGITLDPRLVVALWDYPTSRGSHRYVYLYPWDDPELPFEQVEGQGRGWFTPDEALRTLLLADNARRDLTLLVEHTNQDWIGEQGPGLSADGRRPG